MLLSVLQVLSAFKCLQVFWGFSKYMYLLNLLLIKLFPFSLKYRKQNHRSIMVLQQIALLYMLVEGVYTTAGKKRHNNNVQINKIQRSHRNKQNTQES